MIFGALLGLGSSIAGGLMGGGGGEAVEQRKAYTARTLREKLQDRAVENLNTLQSNLMTNAIGQFGHLAPSLYTAAFGMVPNFEDRSGQAEPLRQEVDRLDAMESDLLIRKSQKKGKAKRIKKKIKRIREQKRSVQDRMQEIEAQPKVITGFRQATPDELPPDSPLSSQNPLNQISSLTNDSLIRALSGEEPVDQSVVNRWRDREVELRASLRRRLGPDFETSTPGIEALSQFEEDKEEAFQDFNRKLVLDYSSLSNANAQLREQQLAGILERGVFLPTAQQGLAQGLSQPVAGFETALSRRQEGRRLDSAAVQQPQSTLGPTLGQIGSGFMGAGSLAPIGRGIASAGRGIAGALGFGGGGPGEISLQNRFGETTALQTPTGRLIR